MVSESVAGKKNIGLEVGLNSSPAPSFMAFSKLFNLPELASFLQ